AYHGAAIANYVELVSFAKAAGRITAAGMVDNIGNDSFELKARIFVNAAGPWIDTIRRIDDPDALPSIRLSKGVHLVFSQRVLPVRNALVLASLDRRIVFVMPHGDYVIVGTTDTDFSGNPVTAAIDGQDVDYLLHVLNTYIDGAPAHGDIVAGYAGVRALADGSRAARAASSVSREEVILEDASGLISVAGGKLTTHRVIADRIVTRIARKFGRPIGRSPTLDTPLPGSAPHDRDCDALAQLAPNAREILVSRYGARASIVASIALTSRALAEPLTEGAPALGAEALFAIRYEAAQTLRDFMCRRIGLTWRAPQQAPAAARKAALIMGRELGWDRGRIEEEISEFKAILYPRDAHPE
ncbi:MAG: glycerol-3-phosphate dehydrogenase/oxidase, partial [Candidatus Binataceae bacterium]